MSIAVVALGVVTVAGVFSFARPTWHPYVMPSPPSSGLHYDRVTYSARDAQRAFAAVGVKLVLHENGPVPARAAPITDLSTEDYVMAVDAFGERKRVEASGFSDYITFTNGKWIKTPRTCGPGAIDAERWRGNIRVIISCTRAGSDAPRLLRLAAQALARL